MKSSADPLISPQPTNNTTITTTNTTAAAVAAAVTAAQSKEAISQAIRTRRLSVLMSPPKTTPNRRTSTPLSSNSTDSAYAPLCDVCQVAGTAQDLVKWVSNFGSFAKLKSINRLCFFTQMWRMQKKLPLPLLGAAAQENAEKTRILMALRRLRSNGECQLEQNFHFHRGKISSWPPPYFQ